MIAQQPSKVAIDYIANKADEHFLYQKSLDESRNIAVKIVLCVV